MNEIHEVRVQLPDGTVTIVSIEVPPRLPFPTELPWRLVVTGGIMDHRVFQAEDLFAALCLLRAELEALGQRLLCAGARIDCYPTGFCRSMGHGQKVYLCPLGRPATTLLGVFDEASPESVGTVQQQQEFFDEWKRSLGTP